MTIWSSLQGTPGWLINYVADRQAASTAGLPWGTSIDAWIFRLPKRSSTLYGVNVRMRIVLVILLGMAALQASAADQGASMRCAFFGDMREKVCPVSMTVLTSSPKQFMREP